MKISVLGTGYLGATHAACLAAEGHDVVGVDRDPDRVASLSSGHAPFQEDGLDRALADGLRAGRLRFTDDVSATRGAEVHFLCVGTPEGPDGDLDLSALWSAVHDLAPHLDAGTTVVGRSTVPVGTTARVRDLLRRTASAAADAGVAWNPEFLREGRALDDSRDPHRIVIGTERDEDLKRLEEVYAPWTARGVPLLRTDPPTAELAKLAANTMLAVRISTVNVLAELCEASGGDVDGLVDIVGADPRIGRDYLQPGPGYGGSCLPKDLRGLACTAGGLGLPVAESFLRSTDDVNEWQRERIARLAAQLLHGGIRGRRVAVLGATFKAGSDDLRDSPALDIANRLADRGATVVVYDPVAGTGVRGPLRVAGSAAAAATGADLLLVLTDWPQFGDVDPAHLAEVVGSRTVVDARRALDRDRWRRAGWQVWTLGVGGADSPPSPADAPAPAPATRTVA